MLVEKVSPVSEIAQAQGLFWFDSQARVVDLNLQAARLLRAEPSWVLMQDFFSLCGKAQPDAAMLSQWQDIQHGRVSGVEHMFMTANGLQIWVALAFSHRASRLGRAGDRVLALALNMDAFR